MNNVYIQLAFNNSFEEFTRLVRYIPRDDRIIIEAGTPLIKREGIDVVSRIKRYWGGKVCADMKIVDGAQAEVRMAKVNGADYVTALGSASKETLSLFVSTCRSAGITSVIDMLGVSNPMKVLWKSMVVPDAVFIHKGRDEENSFGKILQYKDMTKIKGKWDILTGAAGGIDQKELQSAVFNGSSIVVVNVVSKEDGWKGLVVDSEFSANLNKFLRFAKGSMESDNSSLSKESSHQNVTNSSFNFKLNEYKTSAPLRTINRSFKKQASGSYTVESVDELLKLFFK